ncbi:MAG: carotenoid oxygenase [Isosphaera sp.]|nr:carotenoid oxygenase [Isosphaera sp.]
MLGQALPVSGAGTAFPAADRWAFARTTQHRPVAERRARPTTPRRAVSFYPAPAGGTIPRTPGARPMPYRLVVFDFDGTLADSLPATVEIFNRLAADLGHRPVEDVAAARAMTTRQFLRHHRISLWRLPRLVRRFHAAAAERADHLRLFPGLPDALAALRAGGARLGILSSNREDTIRRCLRANGVEGLFGFVVGYPKLFGKGKALRRLVRAERVPAAEVVYVGDEVRDVEAARKAGVAAAAVTWGFHADGILRDSRPDLVVAAAGELAAALTSRAS